MRVVIAPDSFKGTLDAPAAAAAIAAGWRRERPDDRLTLVPLSDGGDGLLHALDPAGTRRRPVAVTGPRGERRTASVMVLDDGLAVIESAEACGLSWVPVDERDPLVATTVGVGELLLAARATGAHRVFVGLGGSATVDGGIGAVSALGVEVRDGTGRAVAAPRALDLARVASARPSSDRRWAGVAVELLTDVRTPLVDAAAVFGPQKGADPDQVDQLARGLERWADVVERDLAGRALRHEPGTGAAGGLAFGLAASLDARLVDGARWVAEAVELSPRLAAADLLVLGEGQLDATSFSGKVLGHALHLARRASVPTVAVVGRHRSAGGRLRRVEEASPTGPGRDPAAQVADATARLARHLRPS